MRAIGVFTNRGLDRLKSEGGSQAWSLKPENAKKVKFLVCVQNRNDGDWGEPTHDQGQGFLLAKITGVEASPEGRPGRYIIRFDEYAIIDKPDMAYQWRNPVRYLDLEDFSIYPDTLKWESLSAKNFSEEKSRGDELALDMNGAKVALSAFYKVPISSIEITIRG